MSPAVTRGGWASALPEPWSAPRPRDGGLQAQEAASGVGPVGRGHPRGNAEGLGSEPAQFTSCGAPLGGAPKPGPAGVSWLCVSTEGSFEETFPSETHSTGPHRPGWEPDRGGQAWCPLGPSLFCGVRGTGRGLHCAAPLPRQPTDHGESGAFIWTTSGLRSSPLLSAPSDREVISQAV